jgi:hypothetical protein
VLDGAGQEAPDGVTPHVMKLKKGDQPFDIQVKSDGFKTETKTITTEGNKEVMLTLAKDVPAVAAVQPKPDKKKPSSTSSSGEKKSKPAKPKEEGTDDMKLLTPKF